LDINIKALNYQKILLEETQRKNSIKAKKSLQKESKAKTAYFFKINYQKKRCR
jgi:hypothetical protein